MSMVWWYPIPTSPILWDIDCYCGCAIVLVSPWGLAWPVILGAFVLTMWISSIRNGTWRWWPGFGNLGQGMATISTKTTGISTETGSFVWCFGSWTGMPATISILKLGITGISFGFWNCSEDLVGVRFQGNFSRSLSRRLSKKPERILGFE